MGAKGATARFDRGFAAYFAFRNGAGGFGMSELMP
jgi:hypothetical protein